MGSWDGAETCELVGLYLLSQLAPICGRSVGLYRDDGLVVTKSTPRLNECLKKRICKAFKDNGLNITIEANLKSVNFLDVTLDLSDNSYRPYHKPNSSIAYVHRLSNHPPSILKNLPIAINTRLNKLASNEALFNEAAPIYQDALNRSGHNYKLNYISENQNQAVVKKRNRNRDVIWYNPPYSSNVKTNLGKEFLKLLDLCFHRNHPLRKIFNRHTVKLSYSCLPSFKRQVQAHNNKILSGHSLNPQNRTCNCQVPASCPLNGQCLTKGIVYQATVTTTSNNHKETYVGISETEFKARYRNHIHSFSNPARETCTRLSSYIHSLKNSNTDHSISWKIVKRCTSYSTTTKRCNLCLYEKFIILFHPDMCTLNSRLELNTLCPHRNRYLLKNYKNS